MKPLLVLTTLPDHATATALAETLLERNLAACVNVLAGCESIYRWQGVVERAQEVPLLIKTSAAAYPALEAALQELHPYDLPEIIAVDIQGGLPAYLDWMNQSTAPGLPDRAID